jgi:cell division septation protein DedD
VIALNLRNLEQIQERQPAGGMSFGTLLLAAAAGGALVVVATTTFTRDRAPEVSQSDALEQLLAEQSPAPPAASVSQDQVTFPSILSDQDDPTTALAAVKDERGRLLEAVPTPSPSASAGVSTGAALPQGQLPVGDLLSATSVTRVPHDGLSQLAKDSVTNSETGELAPAGQQGGFEIQVASFRNPDDADALVHELRRRGHRAYRQAAYVPERGLWHRVRIGSFKSRYKAEAYKRKFEQAESMSTFLVDPEKVKRQQAARDAKARARQRRQERARGGH